MASHILSANDSSSFNSRSPREITAISIAFGNRVNQRRLTSLALISVDVPANCVNFLWNSEGLLSPISVLYNNLDILFSSLADRRSNKIDFKFEYLFSAGGACTISITLSNTSGGIEDKRWAYLVRSLRIREFSNNASACMNQLVGELVQNEGRRMEVTSDTVSDDVVDGKAGGVGSVMFAYQMSRVVKNWSCCCEELVVAGL